MKLDRPTTGNADKADERIGERWNRAAKEKARSTSWRPILIGLFAFVALVTIVVKFVTSGPVSPEAAEPPREIKQVAIEGLSPVGPIPRSEIGNRVPMRFRWQRLESASYYFVRIFGPGGNPIDSGQVTAPPYEVRELKRDLFLANGEFSWEVTAYTADARILGKSERATFTVD